jgi:hypothetical protein
LITLDLVELVRRQENVLRHLLGDGVELLFELEGEPVPVVGDAVALRRLVLNLVLNARDAVAGRGGHITVRVEHTAGRAVLEVADDGPGIPVEVREHLFEPFFTLRRQGRGSGLGLAVVYGIATEHGGEVDVRSEPGEGARFIVRLPLGEAAEVEPDEALGFGAEARVLLLQPDGRRATRTVEVLAGAGLEVRHAPTREIASSLLERWSPMVVVAEGAPDTDAWLVSLEVPVVVVERPGEPESILDALRDLGLIR